MLYIALVFILIELAAAVSDEEIQRNFERMPRDEFVKYFNSLNMTYTIKNYDREYALLSSMESTLREALPIVSHKELPEDLPKNFDSRTKWPHCSTIREIHDQGPCGSCWLFGSFNTASDRICIHTNATVHLAVQEGDCVSEDSNFCGGGSPTDAFMFWQNNGVVTETCKPYNVDAAGQGCVTHCTDKGRDYKKDKHFAEKVYQVENNSMKAELVKNGPIEASITVYDDFKHYHGGVYTHKYGKVKGLHSIRVIGYGTESGSDYWLVSNSWSTGWGEGGHVKISVNAGIFHEDETVTGLPKKQ